MNSNLNGTEPPLLIDSDDERYLLACALIGRPDAVKGVHFGLPLHNELATHIERLKLPGGADDIVIVRNTLNGHQNAQAIKGLLTELTTEATEPIKATIESAQSAVNAMAERRSLRDIGAKLTLLAETGGDCRTLTDNLPVLVKMAMKGTGNNLPPSRSVLDLIATPPDPAATLLGDRFLCREGSMLFVGPSGIGKSSASMQQDIAWALGRGAFGVKPARPLRILTIQAENDDGDLHEMAKGVMHGIVGNLSSDDEAMLRDNLKIRTVISSTGEKFIQLLRRMLDDDEHDLVRIDPLFAFYGAKIEDTEKLSVFCREGINPLLHDYNCGLVMNHHTPKITNRDTSAWSASDYSYAGAGGAELTNWARAILVLDPTATPGTFKWIAAKRGGRIGWRDEHDQREIIRYFRHTRQEGGMHWEEGDAEQVEADTAARKKTKQGGAVDPVPLIRQEVPQSRPIPKNELIAKVNKRGAGLNATKNALTMLLSADEPEFFEHLEKRPDTNPRKLIARLPQL